MNRRFSILSVLWIAVTFCVVGLAWQRGSGVLMAVGVLMIGIAAWNTAALRKPRGL